MPQTYSNPFISGELSLPEGYDPGRALIQLATDMARREFDRLEEQKRIDNERATKCSSIDLAIRYGLSLTRIQGLTRRGILSGIRKSPGSPYAYEQGKADDAINALRRADGGIKGQRRDADPTKGLKKPKAV